MSGQLVAAREREHDLSDERVVALPERGDEQHHLLAQPRVELADHAAVQEVDVPVGPEQVARVRVGVEKAVDQDLAVVRLDQLPCGGAALGNVRRFADVDAVDEVEHEQPRGRDLRDEVGHLQPRVGLQHLAEPGDVCRLLAEVELAVERLGQVPDHRRDVDELAQARAVLGLAREQLEQAEVAHDRDARPAALDLDDHLLAGLERGDVYLPDRPRSERLGLDRLEHVLPGHAQLLLHHRDHVLLGHGRDLVLERRQLVDELGRQQVGPRGEDLPELGEGRAELFERLPEVAGALPQRDVGRPALAQSVLRDDPADLGRAPEQPLVLARFRAHRKNRRFFCACSSTRCIVLTITTVRRVP